MTTATLTAPKKPAAPQMSAWERKVRSAIARLAGEHERFKNSPDHVVSPRRELFCAGAEVVEAFTSARPLSDFLPFVHTLADLSASIVRAFNALDDQGSVPVEVWDSTSFWGSVEALSDLLDRVDAVRAKASRPAETFCTLSAQGIGDEQICRMLGWTDSGGTPLTFMVTEEREKPGTHQPRPSKLSKSKTLSDEDRAGIAMHCGRLHCNAAMLADLGGFSTIADECGDEEESVDPIDAV